MNEFQKGAISVMVPPQVTTAAKTAQARIDGKGFRYATIDVIVQSQHTSGGDLSVLKLTDCDTTATSSFGAIVAFTGGTATSTSAGFVIPSMRIQGVLTRFEVDLTKRKRYLMADLTCQNDTYTRGFAVIARLGREEQSKDTAAARASATLDYTSETSIGAIVRA